MVYPDDSEQRRRETSVALIRADYEQSMSFIDGLVRMSSTIRQTAATASVTLIGLSIGDKDRTFGIAAAVLAAVLGMMDAYHGVLYSDTLKGVLKAERIFKQFRDTLAQPDDPNVQTRLDDLVDEFPLGPISRLAKIPAWRLLDARPPLMYLIYPAAIGGGIVAAIFCK